jgi:hypothetical protein
LRHYDEIKFNHFLQWLNRRLNTLQRTYMNKLYMQRRVGRSHNDIVNDSAAISPTDLFWVTRKGLPHTWESLQILRDENMALAKVSLEGILDKETMFKPQTDHTSIFSAKGAFPKGIYKGHILKKGSNAEYEISAYNIGKHLQISVAEAEMRENEIVACRIFTDDTKSLVHALELLYPFEAETQRDIYEKALKFTESAPQLSQKLQRLFILNYLVSNFDLHGENFGFIYDTATFEITDVAPAFDFNSAFEHWGDVTAYDEFIFGNLKTFMQANKDLVPLLQTLNAVTEKDLYLNMEQKSEIINRAKYLISITGEI